MDRLRPTGRTDMHVSLIVTTYNWEAALRQTLFSAARQVCLPDEILVADDGSRPETGCLVSGLSASSPVPFRHIWQEDLGFRPAAARNRAIAAARGDYIVLVDGDVILDKHFVDDHRAAAQPGWFVQGRRAYLGPHKTGRILESGKWDLHPFLRDLGNRKNAIRSPWLSWLRSGQSQTLRGTLSCNLAFFRDDAIAINGFNEAFTGWGREDSEFALRLLNRGVRRHVLRHRAVMYHLHHPINSRDSIARNDRLLLESQRAGSQWCDQGLDQYLRGPTCCLPMRRAA